MRYQIRLDVCIQGLKIKSFSLYRKSKFIYTNQDLLVSIIGGHVTVNHIIYIVSRQPTSSSIDVVCETGSGNPFRKLVLDAAGPEFDNYMAHSNSVDEQSNRQSHKFYDMLQAADTLR
jgi:hypothetical protein